MTLTGTTTPPRLLSREHGPIAVGIVAVVTLQAFENRAVVSIVPTVVRALDGWTLFGAASGLALVTFTLGMALSGTWTDRVGARRVFLTALAVFGIAQLVSGLAPTMEVFVLGRGLSGLAEAATDTALTVVAAQALPEELRAKVFATFAAAWILPSLVGPSIAGALEHVAGWRAVFIAPLVVLPVTLAMLRPGLRRLTVPGVDSRPNWTRSRITSALVLTAALAALSLSSPLVADAQTRPVALLIMVGGVAVAVLSGRRVLPPGTLRLRRGLPAVIGLRMFTAAGFGLAGATNALMLATVLGVGPALAGLSMSITGTLWAAGSALNSHQRIQRSFSAGSRLRVAFVAMAMGSLGPALIATGHLTLVPGMALWALAALGMGIASPTLSTRMLDLTESSGHGDTSAASGLAISIGSALCAALSGAVVAGYGAAIAGPQFALICLSGAVVALVGAGLSARVD